MYRANRTIPSGNTTQDRRGYLLQNGVDRTVIALWLGLVIPIHNTDGQLIAYCGRSVDKIAGDLLHRDARVVVQQQSTRKAKLVDDGKIKPLLSERSFAPAELEDAFSFVQSGSIGKVAVEI